MTGGVAAFLVLMAVLFATMAAVSLYIYYGRLIMRSRVAGAPVGFDRMVKMTLSGLNANALVTAYLDAHKAGIHVTLDQLEAHARGRGDPRAAVKRFVAAKESGMNGSFEDVCATERAAR
jgi:uncharacterized protein YqfA (UPF0365 family)